MDLSETIWCGLMLLWFISFCLYLFGYTASEMFESEDEDEA